jgi:hypothetical protein
MTTYRGDLPFCLSGQNGMKQEQLGFSSVHPLGIIITVEGRKSRSPAGPAPKRDPADWRKHAIIQSWRSLI